MSSDLHAGSSSPATRAAAVTAAVVSIVLLLSLRHAPGVPGVVVASLVGFAALSAWRPELGLLALAGLVPVAAWTGRTWSEAVAWPETLVVAFAAGYAARIASARRPRRDDLSLPVLAVAAVVAASLFVRLLVLYWTIGGTALKLQLWRLSTVDYFVGTGGFREVDAAMRLLEGLLIFRAASAVALGTPAFGPALVRWFVAGAAAAAVLNLWRIWQGALRLESPVDAFVRYLATVRLNVHYADVNAAGSYFVMALLPAAALVLLPRGRRWILAAALVASSVVLTGSRTALLAGVLAAAGWVLRHVMRGRGLRRSRLTLAVSLILIASAAAAAYVVSSRKAVAPTSTALEIRTGFAMTSLRMAAANPGFGVGIGRYTRHAGIYSSPRLLEIFKAGHENAHNNFFQVLGELGFPGLAALLWLLRAAALRIARAAPPAEALVHRGAAAGLLAFVLTWLAGHPLLIDEPAFTFWLLLGAAAGWAAMPRADGSAAARGLARAAPVLVVALAVAVPIRARYELSAANLEHQGVGVSPWETAGDGQRYRLAGARSSLFVPADAKSITLPLRTVEPYADLDVALTLNGRPANVVRVPRDRWYVVTLIVPPEADAPRFHRLDLHVEGTWPRDAMPLMVGKVDPR